MTPNRRQILSLYKQLLRYADEFTLTDKNYYKKRIKREFVVNKDPSADETTFLYEVVSPWYNSTRGKKKLDKSNFPNLNELDLEETFIKGGGPGGQKVNKSSNCVYLLHKPTGLSVKVQESRYQFQNRKIAREKITVMLDNLINAENSLENQQKKLENEKLRKKIQKQKKLTKLKEEWKSNVNKN